MSTTSIDNDRRESISKKPTAESIAERDVPENIDVLPEVQLYVCVHA